MSEIIIETCAAELAIEAAGVHTERKFRISESDGSHRFWYGLKKEWLRLEAKEYRGLLAVYAMQHHKIKFTTRHGVKRYTWRGQHFSCVGGDKLDSVIMALEAFGLIEKGAKHAS